MKKIFSIFIPITVIISLVFPMASVYAATLQKATSAPVVVGDGTVTTSLVTERKIYAQIFDKKANKIAVASQPFTTIMEKGSGHGYIIVELKTKTLCDGQTYTFKAATDPAGYSFEEDFTVQNSTDKTCFNTSSTVTDGLITTTVKNAVANSGIHIGLYDKTSKKYVAEGDSSGTWNDYVADANGSYTATISTKAILDQTPLTMEVYNNKIVYSKDLIVKNSAKQKPGVVQARQNANGKIIDETSGDYKYLAPLPGFGTNFDANKPDAFPNYLKTFLNFFYGIASMLALIMFIFNAVQYMTEENMSGKSNAKTGMLRVLTGIALMLMSVLILNTIDPNLTNIKLGGKKVDLTVNVIQFMSPSTYKNVTGADLLAPGKYDEKAKAATTKAGIPYCAMRVILQRESNHNPGAIGFDSDVPSTNIGARNDFINSEKKYSGATFTKSSSSVADASIINDDKNYTNTPTIGLDWRFTHGIGLTQLTCNPIFKDYANKDKAPNCTFAGSSPKTPLELLDADTNLEVGANLWGYYYKHCGKNIQNTWKAYASGSCTSDNGWAVQESITRTDLYNQCVNEPQ